jgi:hypothetical protein
MMLGWLSAEAARASPRSRNSSLAKKVTGADSIDCDLPLKTGVRRAENLSYAPGATLASMRPKARPGPDGGRRCQQLRFGLPGRPVKDACLFL